MHLELGKLGKEPQLSKKSWGGNKREQWEGKQVTGHSKVRQLMRMGLGEGKKRDAKVSR